LLAPDFAQRAFRALLRAGPRLGLMSYLAPKIGMLDTTYWRSPLVSGNGPWVGRRAPDGDLITPDGSSIRLLDLVGPQPLLLLFDDGRLPGWDVSQVAPYFRNIRDLNIVLLSSTDAPIRAGAYRDGSNGALWNSWKIGGGAAALVRPDGHVGWMGRRPLAAELERGVRQAARRLKAGKAPALCLPAMPPAVPMVIAIVPVPVIRPIISVVAVARPIISVPGPVIWIIVWVIIDRAGNAKAETEAGVGLRLWLGDEHQSANRSQKK
jgi:hypothetical protein